MDSNQAAEKEMTIMKYLVIELVTATVYAETNSCLEAHSQAEKLNEQNKNLKFVVIERK